MDENWLQIRRYEGDGFQPLVAFNGWRVAVLNYLDALRPDRNDKMERHTGTDEVFVLLKGQGTLLIGGCGQQVDGIYPQEMEIGSLYNVRCNTWHTILLSQDASVLLVEERETGDHNSEYATLSGELHQKILEIARNGKSAYT
jgi:mannose-6-phosphate isomerase-like protein (cupin superfamily)